MTSRKRSFSFNRILAIMMTIMFVVIVGISLDPDASRRMFTANAQSATATLTGTVLDEMGAVVPAVNITMLNRNTALQRHASTNDDGHYVIPLLPPGRYNVTIERGGFTTVEIRDVVLNVNDQLAPKKLS